MRQKSGPEKQPAEDAIRDIRRATRRHFSAEEKIRVVLEGLRGEESIAELCRREGIASSMYYGWSKEFLEAGKRRPRRRHNSRRDLRRGEGSPPRSASVEGGRRRPHPREPPAQKKYDRGWGRRGMRYSAHDKTEIIRLVEQSHLPDSTHAVETRHFPDRPFTAGMIAISAADQKASRIGPHGRIGSGTVSQRLSATRLSTWRWISRN